MITIVFLTLYIDPLSFKTTKTMITFPTQYLQSLGQKESLHAWKNLVRKQSAFLHVEELIACKSSISDMSILIMISVNGLALKEN